MKGFDDNPKACDSREDANDLEPLPESPEAIKLDEASRFKNHFVVRKNIHQQPDKSAEVSDVRDAGTSGKDFLISNQLKSTLKDGAFPSLPSIPSTFMSQRIGLFSKTPDRIGEGYLERAQKSVPSEAEGEPNIFPTFLSSKTVLPREDSNPTYGVDSVKSTDRYQPQRRHSHNDANISKNDNDRFFNQRHSVSSLHSLGSSSSKGKYSNSGTPNVYRGGTQANGTTPWLPLPFKNTMHKVDDATQFDKASSITNVLSSQCIPICPSQDLNTCHRSGFSKIVSIVQEIPQTALSSNFRTDQVEPLVHNIISSEGERPSTSIDISHSSSSDIPSSPSRSARSFLPFPITKQSPGKPGSPMNRLLASDTSLLKPTLMSFSNSAIPEMRRQAPLLDDFQDNRSLSRGFGSPTGSPTSRNVAISPMDNNYSLISKYVRKAESLTEARRMELSSSEAVMRVCGQRCPVPMELIFGSLKNLEKVGEGVFGEVFSGSFVGNGNMRVYKVVAIEGAMLVNGEKQKSYAEILPEIIISQQLSKLHDGYKKCFTDGYIKLHNARITCGTYPIPLVSAWKSWDIINNSDNECPQFTSGQLYIVFEYDHGGDDVESFVFDNARQTFYLTLQVAHILAVGECSMEMEHRDLHWGNILVEKTDYQNVTYHFNGKSRTIPSFGVKACIIDFTIARLVDDEKQPVFLDLQDDEEQFLGTGDHQFDIYRMMRDLNRNEWAAFFPKTNVFWIHYLAEKFFVKGRYSENKSYVHQFFLKELRQLKDSIMEYASCTEFVFSPACERFKQLELKEPISISKKK